MTEPILISKTKLHIINEVRRLRISLGISTEQLAKHCSEGSDTNKFTKIESGTTTNSYTDETLNCIAKFFSKISGEVYTPADFYPNETFKEELIPKDIIEIPAPEGPKYILNEILNNTDFLQKPRSTKEITTFANEHFDGEWNEGHFTSTAFRMSQQENNKLKRIDDGERVWYIDIAYFDDGKGDANKDG
ncbi:hypothetical protein [Echinicola sp. 20G]|uniref:hypothetical protein n=1 Tax=Echinicola sp. 20G TaxID=2781961 RepID=UPI0019109745|nr:hypothetical protein [Echinicola sp. 20G]